MGDRTALVQAYPIIDGVKSDTAAFVRKSEVLENPTLFAPIEGDIEQMIKVGDVQDRKNKNPCYYPDNAFILSHPRPGSGWKHVVHDDVRVVLQNRSDLCADPVCCVRRRYSAANWVDVYHESRRTERIKL